MDQKVVPLHRDRPPIGQFLRVGNTGHQQLETLLESGRLYADRLVFEASVVPRQASLRQTLAEGGKELVLDTNIAELSSPGRFQSIVRNAPWSIAGRPLSLDDLQGSRGMERLASIARFAVEHGFNAVLAPSHFLAGPTDAAYSVDRAMCEHLRSQLDANGGHHIAVDYDLMIPYKSLRERSEREALIIGLRDLPFENLWIRTSGFGADANPTMVRRCIAALRDFIVLQRPIVVDGVAGLAGLALAAFGAAGAIAHGVGIYERFDASDWHKLPRKSEGGGPPQRALIPALDRQLKLRHIEAIAAATNGRRLVACADMKCCKGGFEDMMRNRKAHYLYQRHQQIENLSKVPEGRRAPHFLSVDVATADRRARQIMRLKISDSETLDIVRRESERIERLYNVLEDLHSHDQESRRAIVPLRRGRLFPASKRADA